MSQMSEEARERKRERDRRYKEANREKIREQNRRYREANRERLLEKMRRWHKDNPATPEKRREWDRRYKEENPEKVIEAKRRYRETHLDKARESARQYNKANAEKIVEYRRQHYEVNREKAIAYSRRRRIRISGNGGEHTNEEWQALCDYYGNKCLACGEHKPLTRDHVVPLSMGGSDDIGNIQPLCVSCNCRKGTKVMDYRPDSSIEDVERALGVGR